MKAKVREKFAPDVVLEGWREMRQALPYMNEAELKKALDEELKRPDEDRRNDIIIHLHRRFTKVRQKREIREYIPNYKEKESA